MGQDTEVNLRSPTREVYEELQRAYDHYNERLFGGQLPECVITLQRDNPRTYGYFSFKRFGHLDGAVTDEIALNPTFFAVVPLVETMQTIAHEMTHLWQAHFGEPGRRRYHNDQWAAKMESIGLMPSSTGRPGGKRTGECVADYPIVGGPFLLATEELLTQAFRLSWYDRFPSQQQVSLAQADVAQEHYADLGGGVPARADLVAANLQVQGSSTPDQVGGYSVANKSNRVKYSCSCHNQVWGRPGLRLRCEECKKLFEVRDVSPSADARSVVR